MTWDLFAAAAAADNEALARAVAARQADEGFISTPPASGPREWTVSLVNAAARELIEGALPPLWVTGEVTNWTRARSGHCYFTLRDATAQLRCMMWRDEARRLPTAPTEGMQVRALGRLTLYEGGGEFQLTVSELEARGKGLYKLAFERLRMRLEAEGLTASARKRPVPRCPARVGIVTSPAGAALHDIISVVRRRAPWTDLVLCGCRVQGEGAAEDIARAVRLFARARCVDVLIVGRGGGSTEDLWAFNEEVVARAIADSPIPTISAVGHEVDFTLADLVADLRAPTPSAAAEAAVPDGVLLRRSVADMRLHLAAAVRQRVQRERATVARSDERLRSRAEQLLADHRQQVGAVAGRLNALSPLAALERGFAVPLALDGTILRRVDDFDPGAPFRLRVADGEVPCRVASP